MQPKKPWVDNGIVKLSTAERAIIKSPTGWLSDEIIDVAQNTLHEQFGVPGLQSVVHGQSCNFQVESGKFVQILHNGTNHWMTIGTIGAKHPEVFAYDSMNCTAPDHLQQQTGEEATIHDMETFSEEFRGCSAWTPTGISVERRGSSARADTNLCRFGLKMA